jgi:hypothetical protein
MFGAAYTVWGMDWWQQCRETVRTFFLSPTEREDAQRQEEDRRARELRLIAAEQKRHIDRVRRNEKLQEKREKDDNEPKP